jgi:repressor LexA
VEIAWREVWIGAAMTALLFVFGKFLIGLYLGRGGFTSAFGAAGSLVVLLIWVYYSAQIVLFGAVFTHVYATRDLGRVPGPAALGAHHYDEATPASPAGAGSLPASGWPGWAGFIAGLVAGYATIRRERRRSNLNPDAKPPMTAPWQGTDGHVTIGYMTPSDLRAYRLRLGLTQAELALRLGVARMTITRYERATRRIPGPVEVAIRQLMPSRIPLAGVVAAGRPIEAPQQPDLIDVPPSMSGPENFALTVHGESMRDQGILPNDVVIVRRQRTARDGQTVVALVNQETTLKKFYRTNDRVELRPAHREMSPIVVSASDDVRSQGVVIGVIRRMQ